MTTLGEFSDERVLVRDCLLVVLVLTSLALFFQELKEGCCRSEKPAELTMYPSDSSGRYPPGIGPGGCKLETVNLGPSQ